MVKQNQGDDAPKGAPDWMVTFADMMSLLLCFFVLLLSFSTIEIEKFRMMSGSMRSAFGLRSEVDLSDEPLGGSVLPVPTVSYAKDDSQRGMTSIMLVRLREALEKSEYKDKGNVEVTDRGVTLRLDGDALFESAGTELSGGALEILNRVAEIAGKSAGQIEVEGHTDDLPIRNGRYPSNWELSSARAGSAVRYLADHGVPTARLKAIGYADTRPLVPNDSRENRAKNRRIEILFVRGSDGPEQKGNVS